MLKTKSEYCPCGTKKDYLQCCGQFIEQGRLALTAETLMRSRYSAYVVADEAYLLRSWHESTRPAQLALDGDTIDWVKLEVLAKNQGSPLDIHGTVEFIAHYQLQNKQRKIHEVSRFVKQNKQWFYVDGVLKGK